MDDKTAEQLSVEELQQLLYRKKRQTRQSRLQRLREQGRVLDVAGLTPPEPPPCPKRGPTPGRPAHCANTRWPMRRNRW